MPGSPTTFLRDGQPVKMTSRDVTVQVPTDGKPCPSTTCETTAQKRTLYSAPGIGPVFTELVGVPLPWTSAEAFAMRDANANNFRAFNHFFAMDRAKSTKGAYEVLKKYQGIPWVNTIVADKKGDAMYADIGAIPNVPDALAQQCNTALGTATTSLLGLPILDASRSACDWATDPDAREPGLFGLSHMPHLFRDDFVTNSNDSYWLANPKQPLEGFARIIGDERTARIAAHPHRPDHDPVAHRRDRRQRAGRLHARGHAAHGLQQPPVRRRAGPRRARADVPRLRRDGAELERPGRRRQRLRHPRELGPEGERDLARRDPVPALLDTRPRLRRRRRGPTRSTRTTRSTRPTR